MVTPWEGVKGRSRTNQRYTQGRAGGGKKTRGRAEGCKNAGEGGGGGQRGGRNHFQADVRGRAGWAEGKRTK